MNENRRNFIKGTAVVSAVGIATVPTALQADMTNWLCVVVDTVDKLTTSLKSASDTVKRYKERWYFYL